MTNRFQGSPNVMTSTANQEVVPVKPQHWTIGYHFKNFTFFNESDCTIKINGSEPIFIRANQGISTTSPTDEEVYSFIVCEAGIRFTWIGSN